MNSLSLHGATSRRCPKLPLRRSEILGHKNLDLGLMIIGKVYEPATPKYAVTILYPNGFTDTLTFRLRSDVYHRANPDRKVVNNFRKISTTEDLIEVFDSLTDNVVRFQRYLH